MLSEMCLCVIISNSLVFMCPSRKWLISVWYEQEAHSEENGTWACLFHFEMIKAELFCWGQFY